MNRRLAWKAWRVPVVWSSDEPHAQLTATAETAPASAQVIVNHYHLHLPPGMTADTAVKALESGGVITIEGDQE